MEDTGLFLLYFLYNSNKLLATNNYNNTKFYYFLLFLCFVLKY